MNNAECYSAVHPAPRIVILSEAKDLCPAHLAQALARCFAELRMTTILWVDHYPAPRLGHPESDEGSVSGPTAPWLGQMLRL